MSARIFYVGTENEVHHHARPLSQNFAVEIVSPEKVGALAGKDDLAIFFTEHFRRFRSAIMELKEKQCRTLYAIDGIIEWRNAFENRDDEPACPWTMRPVLCDKVAAIGRSQARMLDFWGNKNKVELVGLPRLDSLIDSKNEGGSPKNGSSRDEPRRKRILVMTAKWPAFTAEQQANLESSLLALNDWFGKHSEVEVIWRLTKDLDQKLGLVNSFRECDQQELVALLENCDALITTPSTAMLEGMLLQKPTAIIEFNDCPQFNNVAWQIRHPDQIDGVLEELLESSPFKLAQQEYALHDTLECHSPALPRMVKLVEQQLAHAAGEVPSRLVPIETNDRLAEMGHEFLYNSHRLVETSDELELKAQLAFMEREYAILKARNELIEKEFEKAKSTIDHVFNNPVVSPFIKAGELAGKLFTRQPAAGNGD